MTRLYSREYPSINSYHILPALSDDPSDRFVAFPNISGRRSSEESRNHHTTPTETLSPLERRPLPPASAFEAPRAARSSTSSTKMERLCDWDGRENERLVFKSESETIDQAECRMFDLTNGERSLPTRRLVMRNRVFPEDFVSYCKILGILRLLFE